MSYDHNTKPKKMSGKGSNRSRRDVKDQLDPPDVYVRGRAKISKDEMQKWLNAPVSGDIMQIPGIGKKNEDLLENVTSAGETVSTAHQMLGVFLFAKVSGSTHEEQCNRFYLWLKSKGVQSRINDIVLACSEKCDHLIKMAAENGDI